MFAVRELVTGSRLETSLDVKVADALRRASGNLRNMRWGDHDEAFVRPVHGLVLLHGDRVVPGKVLGQESGHRTRGHRFMGKGAIEIPRADDPRPVFKQEVEDRHWHSMYLPIARFTEFLSGHIGKLQQGRISVYLLYSFLTLIALLVFAQ